MTENTKNTNTNIEVNEELESKEVETNEQVDTRETETQGS